MSDGYGGKWGGWDPPPWDSCPQERNGEEQMVDTRYRKDEDIDDIDSSHPLPINFILVILSVRIETVGNLQSWRGSGYGAVR